MLVETRGNDGKKPLKVSLAEAILNPSASFNGLYSLESFPQIELEKIADLEYFELVEYVFNILGFSEFGAESGVDSKNLDSAESGVKSKDFVADSADSKNPDSANLDSTDSAHSNNFATNLLRDALESYRSFDNPNLPLSYTKLEPNLYLQNLFTGPTRAFKDMAMQPFGAILCALAKQKSQKYLILTATSGDTGPATLEAIKDKENIFCVCMYPNGGTSDVQRLQMTSVNAKNTKVIALNGDFDMAQSALKDLLSDAEFRGFLDSHNFALSATNSVNFGRIIFQIIYHIHSYIYLLKNGAIKAGEAINIIVPSGNFGNALGAFFAKKMGVKINKIIIATNANCVLYELIKSGKYDISNKKLIKTLSPAMDILKSSNVERVLFSLFGAVRTKELMESLDKNKSYALSEGELAKLREDFEAVFSDDESVLEVIRDSANKGIIIDPHTATGVLGYKKLDSKFRDFSTIICSTAEWTKFAPTILKALNNENLAIENLDCENLATENKANLKSENLAIENPKTGNPKSAENTADSSDQEALDIISKRFSTPIHANIKNLFAKKELNKTILDKENLKATITNWLKENA
ncbi:threonine synthase [Helicobacter sp. 16-1353]|uniref:threonine synthase n=1 Tax=Helicobacter sp. 16-1353 TaxID=2004996 RepID=UPI000DCF4AFF|nr:threonine synthase [Helicobacter sp. 16-1353]RAX54706.1 threonine synthase [Helicobacter sp. 16-1353]